MNLIRNYQTITVVWKDIINKPKKRVMFKIKKNEVLPILLIGTTMLIVIIMLNVLLTIIDYVFS